MLSVTIQKILLTSDRNFKIPKIQQNNHRISKNKYCIILQDGYKNTMTLKNKHEILKISAKRLFY